MKPNVPILALGRGVGVAAILFGESDDAPGLVLFGLHDHRGRACFWTGARPAQQVTGLQPDAGSNPGQRCTDLRHLVFHTVEDAIRDEADDGTEER